MKLLRKLSFPALLLVASACGDESMVEPTIEPNASFFPAHRSAHDQATLQATLDRAADSRHPSVVRLARRAEIHLDSPLTYDGEGTLLIHGRGATIHGPADGDAFRSTGGADLRIHDLTVAGAGEHAIYVEIPAVRAGTVSVVAHGVTLSDNGFSGLWVDDQVHDSPASLFVRLSDTDILRNNRAGVGEGDDLSDLADKDGVRINEGGPGDLRLWVRGSRFEGNEADGLELDEVGDGDVHSTVLRSSFVDNGTQQQFVEDLEDGFDIDEAGGGSIYARFVDVLVTGHKDEGIDLDELDAGGVYTRMLRVRSLANSDDNISVTESEDDAVDGGGDIVFHFVGIDASERDMNDDGDGVKLEEFGAGRVRGQIVASRIAENEDDGIQIDEEGTEGGLLRLLFVTFEGNLDDDLNIDDDVEVIQRP